MYETKRNMKDGEEFNAGVDLLAKEACQYNQNTINVIPIDNQKHKVYIHKNGRNIDSYPAKIIRKQNQQKLKE